jgi:uncharacterized membrane protein
MTRAQALKIVNILVPVIGVGLMIFYGVCDTACSSLRGSFLGVDLKTIGIIYMTALLALALLPASRWAAFVAHLRTLLLSGALGGEILLVRFQIVHETYCPYCLGFGFCVLVLFIANFSRMNRYLALLGLLAGIGAFALFFEGSILPLYR